MRTHHLAVAGVVGLVALGMGTTTTGYAQPAPQFLATDRLEAGMVAADKSALPIRQERLTVEIDGEHASSTLRQTYTNDSSGRIEGKYRLRPGSGAHVDGFAYWNGEEKIVGEVFEREAAHQIYNQVTARRRDPGLLEADGEGAFAFKVFPIESHEDKRVEVRWTQWLERHAQTVHYRAPLTSPGAEIVVTLAGPITHLRSSTHHLDVDRVASGLRIRASRPESSGELDLAWEVDEPAWTPDAYIQAPSGPDEGWFALALAAPQLPAELATAKDLTIVIDRSGSMSTDDKIGYARHAAQAMVAALSPGDRVNVISFDDEVDSLFEAPHELDAATRERANEFIGRLQPGGGTDIALALRTAVKAQAQAAGGRPHVVVFLTDGESDAAAASAVKTGDVRLFTLGLGADVNRPLLERLAAERRGRFTFIEDAKQIEPIVRRLSAAIAKPVLVDVSVTVDGALANRIYPRTLPDVFAEDELRVSGRLRTSAAQGPVTFTIHGTLAGKPVAFKRTVDLRDGRAWTAPLWAEARVDHLLEELALDGSKQELKDEVTTLALAYNFITPFTAFLAVPESELGPAATTLAAARDRKRHAREEHPDAAPGTPGAQKNAQVAQAGGEVITIQGSAPIIDQGSTKTGVTLTEDYTRNVPVGRTFSAPITASRDGDSSDDVAKPEAIETKRHGCAGCQTGGDAAQGFALVGLIGLIALRRRPARR